MLTLEPMPYDELPDAWHSMKTEFPDNERKPLEMLQKLYRKGVYDIWWLKEDGLRKGYAMMLRAEGCQYALLDYLAMLEKGRGYGSACLEALKERYPDGILVEAEAMEEGLAPDTARQRERRLRFYRSAGFAPCSFAANVFGVIYRVHLWAKELPADWEMLAGRAYYHIYQAHLPERWLDTYFNVEGQP